MPGGLVPADDLPSIQPAQGRPSRGGIVPMDDLPTATTTAEMPVKFGEAPLPTEVGKPVIQNPDRTVSTEKTITIEADGKHFLIPTIIGGKERTPDEAVRQWRAGTNQEVGVFGSAQEADTAAKARSTRIGAALETAPPPMERLREAARNLLPFPGIVTAGETPPEQRNLNTLLEGGGMPRVVQQLFGALGTGAQKLGLAKDFEAAMAVAPFIHGARPPPGTLQSLFRRPGVEVPAAPTPTGFYGSLPQIVERVERAGAIEQGLVEAERLRQSQQGGQLLRKDLASRQAPPTIGELLPQARPQAAPVTNIGRVPPEMTPEGIARQQLEQNLASEAINAENFLQSKRPQPGTAGTRLTLEVGEDGSLKLIPGATGRPTAPIPEPPPPPPPERPKIVMGKQGYRGAPEATIEAPAAARITRPERPPDFPADLEADIGLLASENRWNKAVTTPGSTVKLDTGETGKVIQGAKDPVNGVGKDQMVLVEHEFEGRPAQRWYKATSMDAAPAEVKPIKPQPTIQDLLAKADTEAKAKLEKLGIGKRRKPATQGDLMAEEQAAKALPEEPPFEIPPETPRAPLGTYEEVSPGTVRLYRGQVGTHPPSPTSEQGRWFATDQELARFHGKDVSYVDVPKEVADAAKVEEGLFAKSGRLLPPEYASQAKPLETRTAAPEPTFTRKAIPEAAPPDTAAAERQAYIDRLPNRPYPELTAAEQAKQEANARRMIEERYRHATPEVQRQHGINPKTGLIEQPPPETFPIGQKPLTAAEQTAMPAAEAEQQGISARLRSQKAREGEFELESKWQKLMEARGKDVSQLASRLTPDEARQFIDRLNAAPGDNPAVRKALGTIVGDGEKMKTLQDLLKSEKGQIRLRGEDPMAALLPEHYMGSGELGRKSFMKRTSKIIEDMGPTGKKLGEDLADAYFAGEQRAAKGAVDIDKVFERYPEAKATLIEKVNTKQPLTATETAAFNEIKAITDVVGDEATQLKIKVKNPITGVERGFQKRSEYAPQLLDPVKVPKNPTIVVDAIMEELIADGIEPGKARTQAIMMVRNASKKSGSLQFMRTGEFDPRIHMTDSAEAYKKALQGEVRRIEVLKRFGKTDEAGLLGDEIGGIRDRTANISAEAGPEAAQKAEQWATRQIGMPRGEIDTVQKKVGELSRNFNTLKLGFMPVTNLAAQMPMILAAGKATRFNPIKSLQLLGQSFGKTGEGAELAKLFGTAIDNTSADLLQKFETARSGPGGKAAAAFLHVTGGMKSENFIAKLAAQVGNEEAKLVIQKLIDNPSRKSAIKAIERYGLDPAKVIQEGATEQNVFRIGRKFADEVLLRGNVLDLPPAFTSESGKVFFQFKRATQVLGQQLFDAAKNDPGKLIALLAASQIGGEALLDIKGATRGTIAALLSGDPQKITDELEARPQGVRRILDNFAAALSFGYFGDTVMDIAEGKNPKNIISGSTVAASPLESGLHVAQGAGKIVRGEKGGGKQIGHALTREAAGGTFFRAMTRPEISPEKRLLRELGMEDLIKEHRQQRQEILDQLGIER